MTLARAALVAVVALVACGDIDRQEPLAVRGAALARDRSISRSNYNVYACTTCHVERARDAGERLFPGAPLEGAARRPSFWNGEVLHLREAVERCWVDFMRGDPRDLEGDTGDALDAWLQSLAPAGSTTGTQAVRMTWPRVAADLGPNGDRVMGQRVWARACARCHGSLDTGAGRLGNLISIVPRDTQREHCDDELPAGTVDYNVYIRGVAVEKTRHGSYLGYAGVMPPFSTEVLSDDDLRHLTAFFSCP